MAGSASRPLRVVFVLPSLTAGGAERVMITLMNGLRHDPAFAPSLVVVNDGGPLRPLVGGGIPFTALYPGTPAVAPERAVPALYRTLRDARPDIVISTMAPMNFAVLLLRPFFRRTRFIVREAITPSFILERRARAAPLIRAAYRTLYPLADHVVSPAQAIINEFAVILGMDTARHICLPNPVDGAHIRGDGIAIAPGAPADAVRFAAAGRLHHQKGFDRLLDVLPALTIPWHLTLLGEGEEGEALRAQAARLNIADRITFAGRVDRPWPHIAAADAFLLPSRWEGLPNVALEALCCGTPVIATRESGGIAEIAAQALDSVTLCDDMKSFAQAMQNTAALPRGGAPAYRPSLLPPSYDSAAVIEKFRMLLRPA